MLHAYSVVCVRQQYAYICPFCNCICNSIHNTDRLYWSSSSVWAPIPRDRRSSSASQALCVYLSCDHMEGATKTGKIDHRIIALSAVINSEWRVGHQKLRPNKKHASHTQRTYMPTNKLARDKAVNSQRFNANFLNVIVLQNLRFDYRGKSQEHTKLWNSTCKQGANLTLHNLCKAQTPWPGVSKRGRFCHCLVSNVALESSTKLQF